MSFPAKKFNITLPENGGTAWALIGCSRSGKSTLMKHIYKEYFNKHIGVMFTMNSHAPIYKDFKNILVCSEYNNEVLTDMQKINAGTKNKFDFVVVSDDYVSPKIKSDPEITRFLTIGRNCGCSSIFSFQGRTLMNSVGRNQVNYVCIFKQQTTKEWKNIIDEYLDMWLPLTLSMNEKIQFCKEATVDHQFFMIDNILGECYLTKLSKAQAGL
jgi:hypothetical protein